MTYEYINIIDFKDFCKIAKESDFVLVSFNDKIFTEFEENGEHVKLFQYNYDIEAVDSKKGLVYNTTEIVKIPDDIDPDDLEKLEEFEDKALKGVIEKIKKEFRDIPIVHGFVMQKPQAETTMLQSLLEGFRDIVEENVPGDTFKYPNCKNDCLDTDKICPKCGLEFET